MADPPHAPVDPGAEAARTPSADEADTIPASSGDVLLSPALTDTMEGMTVGTPGYMTWDHLVQLRADGHEVGGHSLDHVNVDGLDPQELRRQVCDDRQALQDRGFEPFSFAYPYGGYDDAARSMVEECGYLSAQHHRRRAGGHPAG